ncbi:MAG: 1-(5-phosphoribosyl)-5-[(5-phosphoribosylamino)methylideneamino]imidazole-4-carboxamide isomerase [Enhygromyxa sp.]
MLVIPAIDLLDGRAVRLAKGDRARSTVYSDEPWTLVGEFAGAGAKRIHVVDLDGAFAGAPRQVPLIRRLLEAVAEFEDVEIQVGGGIRDAAAVEQLIDAGVDKVVIGTLAVREPEQVAKLCRRFPKAIVVAIDARDGMVAVEGWTETSTIPAVELARQAAQWGAGALLYTDVSRDGLQVGPAVEATASLQAEVDRVRPSDMIDVTNMIDVIASGGVGSLEHLDALARAGVRAVICGRALYEHSFTLEEAIQRC